MSDSTSTHRRMTPGDDMHLTLLMTPHGLNFVTGQDRQHLLAFGRAAFEAGKVAAAAQQGAQDAEPAAWVATFKPEGLLALHSVVGANLEELKQSVPGNSVFRPLYTHPTTQGVDARDAAFEAVRKAFCKLQRYSFLLDSRGNVRRCADHCGNWVEFDAVHTLFEPQSVDAALEAQAKEHTA